MDDIYIVKMTEKHIVTAMAALEAAMQKYSDFFGNAVKNELYETAEYWNNQWIDAKDAYEELKHAKRKEI